jgi:ethanolamine permease
MQTPTRADASTVPTHGLKSGTLSWIKVAALGTAIAISGCFSGWNYGLALGGWGGMLVAALAMAVLFFCLTQCLAELSAALPHAAGFDSYARVALGPTAGYMAGMSVAIGLAVGTGLAVSFAAAYSAGMLGVGGWPVKGGLLVAVIALQLRGASETASFTMIVGGAALAILVVFCISVAPQFSADHLLSETVSSGSRLFPEGVLGAARCIPFALFLFLGVEQAAQAAAEMTDITNSMPKALMTAICVTFAIGLAVLLLATGAAGVGPLAKTDDPLLTAVLADSGKLHNVLLSRMVGAGALVSLIATFFSLAYASSRQFYHLAAGGYLPTWLARTNRRGAPATALVIVGLIGVLSAAFRPDKVMVVFIFLLSVSHELVIFSFLRLRHTQPGATRPYRAIGGRTVAWIGAALSLAVMLSCYQLQVTALTCTVVGLAALLAYFVAQSRSAAINS